MVIFTMAFGRAIIFMVQLVQLQIRGFIPHVYLVSVCIPGTLLMVILGLALLFFQLYTVFKQGLWLLLCILLILKQI
jgi:hypothetical protein